jgi:predicted membrane-bound spermidine synthase
VLPLLVFLFFCSGAAGLIYQVLWLRLLGLVFGVTVYAASTVWASYMAGLAVGSIVAATTKQIETLAGRIRISCAPSHASMRSPHASLLSFGCQE